MKIRQKKNASLEDETALVQLDRRHTLKESTNESVSEDTLRKTTRANSLGSFEEGNSSRDIEAVIGEKQNKCTRKPTVITESELSSSLLYKNRKAKINSDDEIVEDPKPTVPPTSQEGLEPRPLHDPTLRPVPVSTPRPRKMSSCCWYFTIILVICIACLAVMAGVGGIVYMEFLAPYEVMNIDTLAENENHLTSKENFQQPSKKQDNFHRNEPEIPVHILKEFVKNSSLFSLDSNTSKKVIANSSELNEDNADDKNLNDTNNSKTKKLNKIENKFVSGNQDMEMVKYPESAEHSDISGSNQDRIHIVTKLGLDKSEDVKANAKNHYSLELKQIFENIMPDENADEGNKKLVENVNMTMEKRDSEAKISDSTEGIFMSGSNFDKLTSPQGFNTKVEEAKSDLSFESIPNEKRTEQFIHLRQNDVLLNPMENSIDENSFDRRKHSIDHDPKDNFFDPTELSINRNPKIESLNHVKHSINNKPKDDSLELVEHLIDHIPKDTSLNHDDHSIEHSSKDNSLDLVEYLIDHNLKNTSLNHVENLVNHSSKNNSLDNVEHSNDHNSKNSLDHIGQQHIDHNNTSSNDRNEDSENFDSDDSTEKDSLADDQNKNSNDSAQLVFIRPVVESKAIPVPLAFLRRIGFDIKNPNSHQPMNANDMDIKFSLAEALKYLKSLDTDNKLPSSRKKTVARKTTNEEESEKNVTWKTNDQEESEKMKLPLLKEREDYLNILRKKMFEESS